MKNEAEKQKKLQNKLIDELLKIPGSRLNGSREKRVYNNVNISFEGVEGEALLIRLDDKGLALSTGSACSSKSLEPSHVILATGMPFEIAHGSLRFYLELSTTKKQLDFVLKVLPGIVKELRQLSPVQLKLKDLKLED